MSSIPDLPRREFLGRLALAGTAMAFAPALPAAEANTNLPRFTFCAFSKAFQHLDFEQTADLLAEVGWDGIECPVRKGGQVLPERVEEDLPKLVAALAQRKKVIAFITTDIRSPNQPLTEKVLRTASKLGIRQYRLAGGQYRSNTPIPEQINELRAELKELIPLNQELGLCAGFQNHSGTGYLGAPVWDIYEIIKDLDPRHLGAHFDIGHATVEGGYAWTLHARLMEPFFKAIYVKDFAWYKSQKYWSARWCPLGEGMIDPGFFKWLKRTRYQGWICQHHEYPIGKGAEMARVLKQDLDTLKTWLQD